MILSAKEIISSANSYYSIAHFFSLGEGKKGQSTFSSTQTFLMKPSSETHSARVPEWLSSPASLFKEHYVMQISSHQIKSIVPSTIAAGHHHFPHRGKGWETAKLAKFTLLLGFQASKCNNKRCTRLKIHESRGSWKRRSLKNKC